MRLVLHLDWNINIAVLFNYDYQLSSAVYNLLRFDSSEFSGFLHNYGFNLDGKKYKLFSFALSPDKTEIINSHLILKSSKVLLHISSPLIDSFIKNFLIVTLENKVIDITDREKIITFRIVTVEIIPDSKFTPELKFTLLSPMALSTLKERDGKMQQYFLHQTIART